MDQGWGDKRCDAFALLGFSPHPFIILPTGYKTTFTCRRFVFTEFLLVTSESSANVVNLLCRQVRRAVAAKDGAADTFGEGVVAIAGLNRGGGGRREGHDGGGRVSQWTITKKKDEMIFH